MRRAKAASATEIALAIRRSRAQLAHSLAVLDREYALRHLFVRGARMLHGREFRLPRLGETNRREMLPLGLIGFGLAWLTFAGRGDGARMANALLDGLTHLQRLARDLMALFAPAPPQEAPVADGAAAMPPADGVPQGK